MAYINCLHCSRPLEGRRQFCNQLCKSAEAKRLRKLRASEDAHWSTITSQPTYDLTDVECFAIEARVAANDDHMFDGNGWRITDARDETDYAATSGLHESWADKGADLDVWRLRLVDRQRFGGIVMTAELAEEMGRVQFAIQTREMLVYLMDYDRKTPSRQFDGLDSPNFHNKTFAFEIDELYKSESEAA